MKGRPASAESASTPVTNSSNQRIGRLVPVLLVLITFLAYYPALRAGFIWDDDHYVTKNIVLRNVEGLKRIWFDIGATPQYYPLVFTSFWIEYHVYKLHAFGYHLVNVLLHALNAILLYYILVRINAKWGAFGAILFAIHPVHVESVAWITERKNVLSGAFYLAAMLTYLKFDAAEKRRGGVYLFALFLFLCSLQCKTVTATLPAAILLIIYYMRGRIAGRDWLRMIPFFAIGIGFGLLTSWMERSEVGAEGADWNFSIIERFLIAGRACWFYLAKLLIPAKLTFIYPRWNIDDRIWWQYLYPLAAVLLIAVLWLYRKRIGRGPLVAMLFFGGTLLPALGFFNVYPMRFSFVADHFQYLASIGPLCLIGAAWAWIYVRIPDRVKWMSELERMGLRAVCFVPLLVLYFSVTWYQLRSYINIETLWRDTLTKNPGAWMAHGNLAAELTEQGRIDEALAHAKVVLKERPDLVSTHVNYGDVLIRALRTSEAEAAYRHALEMDANHMKANFELGNLLVQTNRAAEAIPHLIRVVKREPEFPSGHQRLAIAYADAGMPVDAESQFRRALELKPRFPEASYGLARVFLDRGNKAQAIVYFKQAIAQQSNYPEAYNDLATVYAEQGDNERAIDCLREAVRLRPRYVDARFNLATMLAAEGRKREAAEQLELVLNDRKDDVDARKALADLRAELRQPASQPAPSVKP